MPGPDVHLNIRRSEDEEGQTLTVTWDHSFQDVLQQVEELFSKRYTLQFTHRISANAPDGPDEASPATTVKVEDDSLFDTMIEYALDQPDCTLDAQLVETHWWPGEDGKDNYLVHDDYEQIKCAPIVRLYDGLWEGPLRCLSIEHWYSPMSPANLFLTAGLGVVLSLVVAVGAFIVDKMQEEAVGQDSSLNIDLHLLGSMAAVLAGPTYLYAFFIRRDQKGTFVLLRFVVLGSSNPRSQTLNPKP